MFISTAPTIYCTCNQSAQYCLFIIFLFSYNNYIYVYIYIYIYIYFCFFCFFLLAFFLHIIIDDAIFSRWILVTSLVGALAVNFLSPNFTLHVKIIVNMLFMLLLLLLLFFIIIFLIIYKQYNIIFCDYTYYPSCAQSCEVDFTC